MKNKQIQERLLNKGIESLLSDAESIKDRVEHGLLLNRGNRDLNADYLIKKKIKENTTYGIITGASSVIPVMGALIVIVATATAELFVVTYRELELCMEIACNYGYDIGDMKRIFEIFAIVGRTREIEDLKDAKKMAQNKAMDALVKKYFRLGIYKALSRAAYQIERRVGFRAFSRALPVLGIAVGGAINYQTTKNTGLIAKAFYKSGSAGKT